MDGAAKRTEFIFHTTSMNETTSATNDTALTASEVDEIRSAFELFDVKNTGRIHISDLAKILREIAQPSARHLLERLEQRPDDNSTTISLDEFTALLTTPHPNDARDGLQQVFDLFDRHRKGYITIEDLKTIAKELGEDHSESFLQQMMGAKDQVSLDEFREIIAGTTATSG